MQQVLYVTKIYAYTTYVSSYYLWYFYILMLLLSYFLIESFSPRCNNIKNLVAAAVNVLSKDLSTEMKIAVEDGLKKIEVIFVTSQ